MAYLYSLGAQLLTALGSVYTLFFEQTLGQFLGVDRPWWAQNAFTQALNIVGDIFPTIGLSYDLTLAQAIIGYGLVGILIFKFMKFFVGIITGS